jgi:hypothetical protein
MSKVSDAKCSVKGITLAAAGEMSRRLQPVYSVTLKHGVDQASVATNSHDFIPIMVPCPCSSFVTSTPLSAAHRPKYLLLASR